MAMIECSLLSPIEFPITSFLFVAFMWLRLGQDDRHGCWPQSSKLAADNGTGDSDSILKLPKSMLPLLFLLLLLWLSCQFCGRFAPTTKL